MASYHLIIIIMFSHETWSFQTIKNIIFICDSSRLFGKLRQHESVPVGRWKTATTDNNDNNNINNQYENIHLLLWKS